MVDRAFEFEAGLAKEVNRPSKVIDRNSYAVRPFERHLAKSTNCRLEHAQHQYEICSRSVFLMSN